MAHPIISFIHPENSKRYFFVMDTFFNYPETIPMNLLNLMQYQGLDNFEAVEALYSAYSKLMQDGSTMPGDSFEQTNPNIVEIIYQTVRFAEVNEAYVAVSLQLEEIFLNSKGKEEFLASYEPFIENLNLYPPYPFHYYLSFDSTFRCLHNIKKFKKFNDTLAECLKNESLEIEEKKDFYKWLEGGYLLSHKALFTDIFYKLAEQNLIELASVPHIFREDPKIKNLFETYNLKSILFRDQKDYNIHHRYTAVLKDVRLTDKVMLQILSDQMHNVFEPGHFFWLTEMEYFCFTNLGEYLRDYFDHYFTFSYRFVNFFDDRGFALYPHGLSRQGIRANRDLQLFRIGTNDTLRLFDKNGLKTNLPDSDEIMTVEPDGIFTTERVSNYFGRYNERYKNFENNISVELPFCFYIENFRYYSKHNCFFLISGLFSLTGEKLSPHCFTDAVKHFSEGLLAVKMNGRWGYLDENYKLVIPPVFGFAQDFRDGFAKVFLYEKKFLDYNEEWIQVPSWITTNDQMEIEWDQAIFEQKFPDFPKYYWLNLNEKPKSNYLGKDEVPDIEKGAYGIINRNGEILYVNHEKQVIDTPGNGQIFLKDSNEMLIDLNELPKVYSLNSEPYDYRNFIPKYVGADKVLSDLEKEEIKAELKEVLKKKSFTDFYKLPIAAKKDEDFIYELRKEKLLRHYNLPNYLEYNERFIELALNQGEIDKHRIPWAFKEKFKDFGVEQQKDSGLDDELPF